MKTNLFFAAAFAAFATGWEASAADPDFALHEWGTFTTVAGSDGVLLPGLEREEERLPAFVRAHDGMQNVGPRGGRTKGYLLARPLANVFVKMETPVIYFYSDHESPFRARVEVGFDGGSISQWFPPRSGGETPPPFKRDKKGRVLSGQIDFARHYDGEISWDVEVLPRRDGDMGRVFQGGETLNWIYPRMTDSNLVRTADGSTEKYLFYRGVGKFELPLVTTASAGGTLTLLNRGEDAIPSALVFDYREDGSVRFASLGALGGGESRSVDCDRLAPVEGWRRAVYDALVAQLRAAGLHAKEADGMVQTWWESYFERPGLRVFWVVPEDFTERVLPLSVEPAPRESVRVLVGRSEVLTPGFEDVLAGAFGTKEWKHYAGHRYLGAYAARAKALRAGDKKVAGK